MLRFAFSAAAAAALTFGAVCAVNAEDAPQAKVTVDAKTGNYCLAQPAMTGTRIQPVECHSQAVWAEQGVTFAHKPTAIASR